MDLPLRYAASIPVALAALAGLLAPALGRRGFAPFSTFEEYPPAATAIFAAVAALLLVVPNIVAAAAGNRWSSGGAIAFVTIFVVVFLATWFVQALVLEQLFASKGGVGLTRGASVWTVLVADIGICLMIAWWCGRTAYD